MARNKISLIRKKSLKIDKTPTLQGQVQIMKSLETFVCKIITKGLT